MTLPKQNYLAKYLKDFPKSEQWRLMTDGWEHNEGPTYYTDIFYAGMYEAYDFLYAWGSRKITSETILQIYSHAFRYEERYKEFFEDRPPTFRQGRTSFEIGPDFEQHQQGLSVDGLDEFVDELVEAYDDDRWKIYTLEPIKGEQFKFVLNYDRVVTRLPDLDPLKFIDFCFKENEFVHPAVFAHDKNKIKEFLKNKLKNPASNIMIMTQYWSCEDTRAFVDDALKQFYLDIVEAKDENHKIEVIVKLIRKLHRNHVFLDGNGRTFCFCLLNLLAMQYLNSMLFNFTPAHFAAFSTRELVAEVKRGMAEYKKYKISNAKKFIIDNEIGSDPKAFAAALVKNLANEKLIALAQISELYVQIEKNIIQLLPAKQEKIKELLIQLYLDNLHELLINPPADELERISEPDILLNILHLHDLYHVIGPEKIKDEVNKFFKKPQAEKEQKDGNPATQTLNLKTSGTKSLKLFDSKAGEVKAGALIQAPADKKKVEIDKTLNNDARNALN